MFATLNVAPDIPLKENEKDPFVFIPCKVLKNGGPWLVQA